MYSSTCSFAMCLTGVGSGLIGPLLWRRQVSAEGEPTLQIRDINAIWNRGKSKLLSCLQAHAHTYKPHTPPTHTPPTHTTHTYHRHTPHSYTHTTHTQYTHIHTTHSHTHTQYTYLHQRHFSHLALLLSSTCTCTCTCRW